MGQSAQEEDWSLDRNDYGSKPDGYLFGMRRPSQGSLFERFLGSSPGYLGFDPQPNGGDPMAPCCF